MQGNNSNRFKPRCYDLFQILLQFKSQNAEAKELLKLGHIPNV